MRIPEELNMALMYAVLGASFGVFKFFKRREEDQPLRIPQLTKTIVIWGVAGIITSRTEGTVTQATVAGVAGGVAPTVNALWDAYLPPILGGSDTHGTGATKNGAVESNSLVSVRSLLAGFIAPNRSDDSNAKAFEYPQQSEPRVSDQPTSETSLKHRVNICLDNADYHELRSVAGQIDSVNGNQSEDQLRSKLARCPPRVVLDAFETVEQRGQSDDVFF